jgi:hypothetical protein
MGVEDHDVNILNTDTARGSGGRGRGDRAHVRTGSTRHGAQRIFRARTHRPGLRPRSAASASGFRKHVCQRSTRDLPARRGPMPWSDITSSASRRVARRARSFPKAATGSPRKRRSNCSRRSRHSWRRTGTPRRVERRRSSLWPAGRTSAELRLIRIWSVESNQSTCRWPRWPDPFWQVLGPHGRSASAPGV